MHVVKKIVLGLCVALFGPIIVLMALTFAFNRTIGQPEFVKRTFREAKLYEDLSELAGNSFGEEGDASSGNELVAQSIKATVTPDVVQKAFEQVIDGFYNWMDGQTEQIEFAIDLAPIKQGIADSLRQNLQAKANSLPACTYANLPTSTDILELDCIPPGTDINAAINQAIDQTINSGDLLADEVITPDNIGNAGDNPADGESASINDQVEQNNVNQVGALYRFVKRSLPYFIGASVLLAIGIFFLSKSMLRGVRKISVLLLANGLLLLLSALLMQALVRGLIPESGGHNQTINASLELAGKIIIEAFVLVTRNFGIVFSSLGLVGTIASSIAIYKTEPKRDKPEDVHQKLKDEHTPQQKADK